MVETFRQSFDVAVYSVMWMGSWILITIPEGIQPKILPSTIAGHLTTYTYPGRPGDNQLRQAAHRAVIPTETTCDESDYRPVLRPGVMVSCRAAGDNELLTTTGVPVKHPNGKKHVTVATYEFPLGE